MSVLHGSIQGKIVSAGTFVLERKGDFGEIKETRIVQRCS